MSTLKVLDADGSPMYLAGSGTGTELDPFKPEQDVNWQDQHTPRISLFLGQHLDLLLTLRSTQSENVETINITSATLPVAGNFLCIKEGTFFSQIEISSVASVGGNDYDVDISMPLDHEFTTSAVVCLLNCDMNVDGSSTPVEFSLGPNGLDSGEAWDLTRMIATMTHADAGDDGLFGDEDALANGVYFRAENGTNYNHFNAKENGDFAQEGYDIAYPTRSGKDGVYGTRARITFNGPDKSGIVIRLYSTTSDKILACVRDNLTSLSRFRIKYQGHVVE